MSKSKKSIDQDLIRDLAALLRETDLSEIELEQDEWRIRVVRTRSGEPVVARKLSGENHLCSELWIRLARRTPSPK